MTRPDGWGALEGALMGALMWRGPAGFAELLGTPFSPEWLTGPRRVAFEVMRDLAAAGVSTLDPGRVSGIVRSDGNEALAQEVYDALMVDLDLADRNVLAGDIRRLVSDLADALDRFRRNGADPADELAARWVSFNGPDLEEDPPAKEFLWEGRIPRGDVGTLAAAGGTGKSSFVTGLAVHRACGMPFLGCPVRAGTTVIVTTEDSRDDFLRKIAAWRQHQPSLDSAAIARHVHLIDLAGEPFRLVQSKYGDYVPTEHVEALAALICSRAPDVGLVVLETVSRMGGDESNPAMSTLVVAAEKLSRVTGASVLLVAHVSKAAFREKNGDAYVTRGGSAITDNGRFTLTLSPVAPGDTSKLLGLSIEREDESELLVLRVPKINSAPVPAPLVVRRVGTTHGLVLERFDEGSRRDAEDRRRNDRRVMGMRLREMADRFERAGEKLSQSKLSAGLFRDVPGLTKARIASVVADAIMDGYLRRGPPSRGGGAGCLLPGRSGFEVRDAERRESSGELAGGLAQTGIPVPEPSDPARTDRAGEFTLPARPARPAGDGDSGREGSGEFPGELPGGSTPADLAGGRPS